MKPAGGGTLTLVLSGDTATWSYTRGSSLCGWCTSALLAKNSVLLSGVISSARCEILNYLLDCSDWQKAGLAKVRYFCLAVPFGVVWRFADVGRIF